MGHQVIKLQNPLKTLGFLQFYRFKTVKDRIVSQSHTTFNMFRIHIQNLQNILYFLHYILCNLSLHFLENSVIILTMRISGTWFQPPAKPIF